MNSEERRRQRWAQLQKLLEAEPYWRLLGIRIDEIGEGYCRLRLPLSEGVRNFGRGPAHGGALASLVDVAVATALDSLDMPDMSGHTTVELNVSFLAPASGEAVLAEGRILRVGRRLVVGEAELRDAAGQLVAKGGATYLVWRGREV